MYLILIITFLFSYGILNAQSGIQQDIPWSTLADSPWPMSHKNPQSTGRSEFKGPQLGKIKWAADFQFGIFSGPVIGPDGTLFFGCNYQGGDNYFYAVAPNGELKWSYKTSDLFAGHLDAAIIIGSDSTIYFGARDTFFYALTYGGELKWKYKTENEIYQHVITIGLDGTLYFTTIDDPFSTIQDGFLFALNSDGILKWKKHIDSGFGFQANALSPDGNTIYICGRDSNLYALDLNGEVKWIYSCGKNSGAPLVDSDGNIYIYPRGIPSAFFSIEPDGNLRWKYIVLENSSKIVESSPTIDKNGNLYFTSSNKDAVKTLFSVDYDGNLRWTYEFTEIPPGAPVSVEDFTQPLICDNEGTVYLGSTFGHYYYAIDSSGNLKWKIPLNEYQVDNTSAIDSNGTLYIGVHKSIFANDQEKNLIAISDDTTTSISDNFKQLNYILSQNYPNPFNPNTKIDFIIKKRSNVKIVVYDILGNEISVLINEEKPAGNYSLDFNGDGLTSGVYFYTIVTRDFTETKKMILLR
jgi:outer membrane protein assembly factor BamB